MKYLLTLCLSVLMLSCATKSSSEYAKIQYEAGACFGFCPIFTMTINPDRTAVIDAQHFTFSKGNSKDEFSQPKEGIFKATITEAEYNKMITLLNGANLKSLNDEYINRNISDLPTAFLRVDFSDGTKKNIQDYGKNGTPKLKEIYTFMESLRETQKWEKVNP